MKYMAALLVPTLVFVIGCSQKACKAHQMNGMWTELAPPNQWSKFYSCKVQGGTIYTLDSVNRNSMVFVPDTAHITSRN